jgi:hypothetical protein
VGRSFLRVGAPPRRSRFWRPNADMGLVAVGRLLKFPIQNNIAENRARHRNPPGWETRGIDVGGYMRKEAWSRETGRGRPISAVGVRGGQWLRRPSGFQALPRLAAHRSSSQFPCGPPEGLLRGAKEGFAADRRLSVPLWTARGIFSPGAKEGFAASGL